MWTRDEVSRKERETHWLSRKQWVISRHSLIDCGGIGEKMEIHMNVTFPRMPCELLTLDVMDVSGEVQTGVMHGVNKVRLSPENEGGHVIASNALEL